MVVTSLENEKVKKFKKLQKKKYRDQYGEFIIEGEHLIYEAFKKGLLIELILEEGVSLSLPVPYTYYTKEVMSKISTMDTPSSIMGLCRKRDDDDFLGDRILILDEIQDPGNLGTIIRSAVAFNVDTIVLSENTVDLYNPKVLRATQGMLFHINIINRMSNDIIPILKNMNIPIYGTNVHGGIEVKNLSSDEKKKIAIVMGNEGNGVRKNVLDMCDKYLYINMNEDVESLNVAVATSIILYELER